MSKGRTKHAMNKQDTSKEAKEDSASIFWHHHQETDMLEVGSLVVMQVGLAKYNAEQFLKYFHVSAEIPLIMTHVTV